MGQRQMVPKRRARFADDCKCLLNSLDEVTPFKAAMRDLGLATNQHLNLSKTRLLPIGHGPHPAPGTLVAGLEVVSSAKALGITFHSGTTSSSADLDILIPTTLSCYSAAGLPAFGRGIASASYGVSHLLHAAEFTDLPANQLVSLNSATAALVDREALVSSTPGEPSTFAGVRRDLLTAPAVLGGFGALPLQAHLTARRGKWAIRLLLQGTSKLWSHLAWSLLAAAHQPSPPMALLMQHMSFIQGQLSISQLSPPLGSLPAPLRHLMDAAASLPHLQCRRMNLEGQPSFVSDWIPFSILFTWRLSRTPLYLDSLLSQGTPVWHPPFIPLPGPRACLGFSLWDYSVAAGTRLLTQAPFQERLQRFKTFLAEADVTFSSLTELSNHKCSLLLALWRLPTLNDIKEVYWRCFLDGLPTAAQLHRSWPCLCGTSSTPPDRHHHFGTCPIALAIVDTIRDHLGLSPEFPLLGALRSGTPPTANLHRGVWLLVCLAAHQAMDFGRRAITATRLQSNYSDGPTATSLVAGNASFLGAFAFLCLLLSPPSLGAPPISTSNAGFYAGIPSLKCGKFFGNVNQ